MLLLQMLLSLVSSLSETAAYMVIVTLYSLHFTTFTLQGIAWNFQRLSNCSIFVTLPTILVCWNCKTCRLNGYLHWFVDIQYIWGEYRKIKDILSEVVCTQFCEFRSCKYLKYASWLEPDMVITKRPWLFPRFWHGNHEEAVTFALFISVRWCSSWDSIFSYQIMYHFQEQISVKVRDGFLCIYWNICCSCWTESVTGNGVHHFNSYHSNAW